MNSDNQAARKTIQISTSKAISTNKQPQKAKSRYNP